MKRVFLLTGSISCAVSVILGAFGAHALKEQLELSNRLSTYETAVQYQFFHSLGLIFLAILIDKHEHKFFNYSGRLMSLGILVFSGSLYVLCLSGITWLGAITPIGGVCFILAWLYLAFGTAKTF